MRSIILIAHDIRSAHNVGALLRTAECMGVEHVYLTGYTPYPAMIGDERMPHIHQKLTRQIDKTALGATELIAWSHAESAREVLQNLKREGYTLASLEQTTTSTALPSWLPAAKIALLLGREVEGIDPELLALCDETVEIPQFGTKESLNVVQAAAMALYHLRFFGTSLQ